MRGGAVGGNNFYRTIHSEGVGGGNFPMGDFPIDYFPTGYYPIVQFPKQKHSKGYIEPSEALQAEMGGERCDCYELLV